jgi:hypothetical protein
VLFKLECEEFQDVIMFKSFEVIEKSWALNEPTGYAFKPGTIGVCKATTGVLSDDACRLD